MINQNCEQTRIPPSSVRHKKLNGEKMKSILQAVEVLENNGYQIVQWFDKDDDFFEPKVRWEGTEFDLIRMYELFDLLGYPVLTASRCYTKDPIYDENDNEFAQNWIYPDNELTFVI